MKTTEHPKETRRRAGSSWVADLSMFAVRGAKAPRLETQHLFEAHGLEEYFPEISAESLLKRSVSQGSKPPDYVCRVFARPNKDTPLSFGVYRIDAVVGESGDEHSCVARVRLEKHGEQHIAVARDPESNGGGGVSTDDRVGLDWAREIADRANDLLQNVDARDLGSSLRRAIEGLGAAKSLGGGNNYIVPPDVAERWHEFLSAIRDSIGVWSERIVLTTDMPQNTRIAREAAEASLEADLQQLVSQLKETIEQDSREDGKKRRKSFFANRIKEGEQLRAKARLFAELLGEKRAELEQLSLKMDRYFNALLDGAEVAPEEAEVKWLKDDEPSNEPADTSELGW